MFETLHERFWRVGNGFETRGVIGAACPPYIIASVAADRVRPGQIELPAGYDDDALSRIRFVTGAVGATTFISHRQATELAEIGAQILALRDDQLDEPLRHSERQAITFLVETVGKSRA